MKVLMLNYEFPPIGGGSGNATLNLLKQFADLGDLTVDLVTSSEAEFSIEKVSEKISVHRLPVGKRSLHYWRPVELARYTWRAILYIRRLTRETHYDICHCWSGWPPGLIGLLFRQRIPYIVALRGSDVPGYSARLAKLDQIVFKPMSRIVWGRAKSLIANSEDLRRLALQTLSIPIQVIPNGVDCEKFRPGGSQEGSALRVLFVGRFVERKGVPILLEAVEKVDSCVLTLVGDGKCAQEWQSIVERRGLADRVRFVGHVTHDQINECYHNADVFVMPSDKEGMSNSLLEAMASGLAVVVTATGGAQSLVGEVGLILQDMDSDSLSVALKRLADDRTGLQRMKTMARRKAITLTWSSVTKAYLQVYGHCVGF